MKPLHFLIFIFWTAFALTSVAADWPMWKHNSGRTANSPDALPNTLHLQWIRQLPPARQAWRDKSNRMLFFDASYEPIVAGKLMFVGSMNTDRITAYSTETGAEKWRFYTGGPVRFAPVAHKGKLYVGSDDGFLYCLDARRGTLIWKRRGGPSKHRVLGNKRLIGMWPFRGAPVIHNDVLYCAAGIWPFMGTFIYALEPNTGKVIWCNSGNGSRWITQQHGAPAFAGVAAQGYIAATDDILLIPSGRSVPGAFSTKSGAFLYNHAASRRFGKGSGGYAVSVAGKTFACDRALYELETGKGIRRAESGVMTAEALYTVGGDELGIMPLNVKPHGAAAKKERGRRSPKGARIPKEVGHAYIKAGDVIYCARNDGTISAVNIADPKSPSVGWQGKIDGKAWTMLAADDRLFVVNTAGSIFCFGAKHGQVVKHATNKRAELKASGRASAEVDAVLKNCEHASGYCVVLGVDENLLAELVARSKFHIIVVDSNPQAIAELRKELDDAGLYGNRVAAIVADPFDSGLPPYLANALVLATPQRLDAAKLSAVFDVLRPYGGVAVLPGEKQTVTGLAETAGLQKAETSQAGKFCILKRAGSLPGTAPWTHQYADAGNSVVSKDKLVKPPFGLLWFGGPTNDHVLPRHGHGPNPQVAGGRILIEGQNMLRALDAYTGRLLWERQLKKLGYYYRHTNHHPGANEIGSNYVSLEDAVYILYKEKCLKLDPATGKTAKEFALPAGKDGAKAIFGSIRVEGDYLVVTALPLGISAKAEETPVKGGGVKLNWADFEPSFLQVPYASASKMLVVMDRHSGEVLWSRRAVHGFRHNAVIATGSTVFCLDKLSARKEEALAQRGLLPPKASSLLALDIRSGKLKWQTKEDVFGTWLGYSSEHDVLIQGGSAFKDRARDEIGKGVIAYRGKDGKVLWEDLERRYDGPLMLRHRELITNGNGGEAWDLFTGKPGGWSWRRYYGCNTAIGGEHVLTFRSGAAGYYDLANRGGTGNLGGFKSGCTSNLIPGDGLLTAPDYTRTCTCSYQNQTSLALRYMPQAEIWTFAATETPGRFGINFGAPGDRVSKTGTLWTEFPLAGSPVMKRDVKTDGGQAFRRHSALFTGDTEVWVGASGIEDVKQITANPRTKGPHTVRLYFAEPDMNAKPGSRVFSVSLGKQKSLADLDIVKEVGAPRRILVKEFKGVQIDASFELSFTAGKGKPLICGVEIISEQDAATTKP